MAPKTEKFQKPAELFSLRRAASPRPPALGPAAKKAEAEAEQDLQDRRAAERRSVLRGLILLAAVAVLFSIFRSGWQRMFYHGWWRQW